MISQSAPRITGTLSEIVANRPEVQTLADATDIPGVNLEFMVTAEFPNGAWFGNFGVHASSATLRNLPTAYLGQGTAMEGGTLVRYGAGVGWVAPTSRTAKLRALTVPTPGAIEAIAGITLTEGVRNAGSTIASGVAVSKTDPVISYSAPMIQAGAAYPHNNAIKAASVNYGSGGILANLTRCAFYYDGLELECQVIGFGDTAFTLYVDGKAAVYANTCAADGGLFYRKITFPTSTPRLIEWEFNSATRILGWVRTPTATIWAKKPNGVKAIFLGDSFTEGPNAVFVQTSKNYSAQAGRMLGWSETMLSGVGATGFIAAPAGKLALIDRISTDVVPFDPDAVVVAMGINDGTLNYEIVYATLKAIRDGIDINSPIFVFGVWNPKSVSVTARDAIILQACQSVSLCYFVDSLFFTGTGKSGSPVGDGNSDIYVYTDNTHPTELGASYLAIRAAAGIAKICATF